MARNYKSAKTSVAPAKKSRGGTLIGIFIGLVIGVGAAFVVVWYMNKTPAPFVANKTGAPVEPGKPLALPPGATVTPAPLPGKPGDAPVEKRFQFYDILPGKSEPRPDGATPSPQSPAAVAAGKSAEAGKAPAAELQLQAGSFQNSKDADNLKATLALSGLEAGVQQVMVGDKVWYRVRLGPYAKPEEANKVKAELSKIGVEASIVKGKD